LRQGLGGSGAIALHLDLIIQQGVLNEYAVLGCIVDSLRDREIVHGSGTRRLLSTEA
jgi:hypothetical protein